MNSVIARRQRQGVKKQESRSAVPPDLWQTVLENWNQKEKVLFGSAVKNKREAEPSVGEQSWQKGVQEERRRQRL